ncbi:hypothetical protein I79_011965 [Cricetulus griseus]|uniref:Uncharacterized protein n=1 Tax=Cricetulus griseus TaxID=10029 RepID=G3HMK0_CRIGR|nr:hypothetical protein I79_011965 [Cricetulus griseus]
MGSVLVTLSLPCKGDRQYSLSNSQTEFQMCLNYSEKWSAKFTSNIHLEMKIKIVFYFLKMQYLFNMDIIVYMDHTAKGPSLRSVICFVFYTTF